MFPTLLIALLFSLLIALLVFLVAFLDVAFAGPEAADFHGRIPREWQPPLIHDEELFAWAAAAAQSAVRRCLPQHRGSAAAKAIAGNISAGTTYALARSPHAVKHRGEHACSSCRHQMIAVTAPEVLAIVEAIRAKRPGELRRVRELARENASRVANIDHRQYAAAKIVCPLHCAGNTCAANGSRPLQCRGWLPLAEDERDDAPLRGDAARIDPHAYTVSQGAMEGLSRELNQQGLDGERYELSSALAVALETPRAARLWATCQPVFAGCKRHDAKPSVVN